MPAKWCASKSTVRKEKFSVPSGTRASAFQKPIESGCFTAFHRGHNVEQRPGTSLALVIVKRCVDLHGGKIDVERKLGEGTSVTVRLPI
jgi:light-regulated signal transduction histidine kinase (bacteriophytochrome)